MTSSAAWSSSDPTVAVIDTTGLATPIDNGQVVIQATVGSVIGSTGLTVTPGQLDAIITPVINTGGGGDPNQKAIAVGSDGFTRFVTADASGQVVFVRCLDTDCVTSNSTTFPTGLVEYYSMSIGPGDLARVAYDVFTSSDQPPYNSKVYFIQCNDVDCGSFTSTFVDTGSGVVSVASNGGTSYIVYDDGNDNDIPTVNSQGIGLATCTGSSCGTTHIVSFNADRTLMGAITLDANGNPILVYNDSGDEYINVPDTVHYYANGTDTVISSHGSQCCQMDVEMGPDGFARVLFPAHDNAMDFVQCADAVCATNTVNGFPNGGDAGLSLAVATDGTPSIEFGSGMGTVNVDYILCTKPDCSKYSDQIVPGTWGNQYEISVALDQKGLPRMIAQAQGSSQNQPGPHDHVRTPPPDHLVVLSDDTNPADCMNCTTVARIIRYSEVDVNEKNVGTISTKEQFASIGPNTCNTAVNTSQTSLIKVAF